jgi:hypothetical protein
MKRIDTRQDNHELHWVNGNRPHLWGDGSRWGDVWPVTGWPEGYGAPVRQEPQAEHSVLVTGLVLLALGAVIAAGWIVISTVAERMSAAIRSL